MAACLTHVLVLTFTIEQFICRHENRERLTENYEVCATGQIIATHTQNA